MPTLEGRSSDLCMGEELSYNVVPATPTYYRINAALEGFNPGITYEELVLPYLSAALDHPELIIGNVDVVASVPFAMGILGLAKIFKWWIGPATTTGAGPYTHTIKRGNLPTGLFLEINYGGGLYVVLSGGKIQTGSITIPNSGLITGSIDILFSKVASSGASRISGGTIVDLTTTPVVHRLLTTVNEGTSGGSPVIMEQFNLTEISTEVQGLRKLGSQWIDDTSRGRGNILGNVIFRFADGTYITKLVNQTATGFVLTLTSGTNTCTFTIPNARYIGNAYPAIESQGPILQTMNFRGLHDATDSGIKLVFVTSEATV
jgi:hypothetical protein